MGLSFDTLRAANFKRMPHFKNCHGQPAHSEPDGSDWSPSDWLEAVVGELGEYANKHKKFKRGDLTLEQFAVEAASELADVACYLDILARRCLDTATPHETGINLGRAVTDKFNVVSERVDSTILIDDLHDGWYSLGGR